MQLNKFKIKYSLKLHGIQTPMFRLFFVRREYWNKVFGVLCILHELIRCYWTFVKICVSYYNSYMCLLRPFYLVCFNCLLCSCSDHLCILHRRLYMVCFNRFMCSTSTVLCALFYCFVWFAVIVAWGLFQLFCILALSSFMFSSLTVSMCCTWTVLCALF
jgi:hypothetical protein